MTSTLGTYLHIMDNMSRYQSMTAAEPLVKAQTEYYQKNIGSVKTPSDLVNNFRLFSYVMTAYGLGDMIPYGKGVIQKVLEQGIDSTKDLAYTLNNPQILSLAATFNFPANGESTTTSKDVQTGVVNNYIEQQLEADQGQTSSSVQQALYFQANAHKITSAYSFLADKTMLGIAQTALGISPYMSYANIDTQAKIIESNLTNAGFAIKDFQDPAKVRKFVEKFAVMSDVTNGGSSSSTALVPNAMLGGNSSIGLSTSLLASMQRIKAGSF
jgi:hypothetical protein